MPLAASENATNSGFGGDARRAGGLVGGGNDAVTFQSSVHGTRTSLTKPKIEVSEDGKTWNVSFSIDRSDVGKNPERIMTRLLRCLEQPEWCVVVEPYFGYARMYRKEDGTVAQTSQLRGSWVRLRELMAKALSKVDKTFDLSFLDDITLNEMRVFFFCANPYINCWFSDDEAAEFLGLRKGVVEKMRTRAWWKRASELFETWVYDQTTLKKTLKLFHSMAEEAMAIMKSESHDSLTKVSKDLLAIARLGFELEGRIGRMQPALMAVTGSGEAQDEPPVDINSLSPEQLAARATALKRMQLAIEQVRKEAAPPVAVGENGELVDGE